MSAELLVVDDALFDLHAPSANHPERPARLAAARAGLVSSGVKTERMESVDAERVTLEAVHGAAYLDALDGLRGKRGMLDADTYVSSQSVEAAVRAAGSVAAMAEALVAGRTKRALALVRPPGHHAEADHAMGFCLLNNIAVAAAAARLAGARRVAIVDIDVHHGNGTQSMFWDDPQVLYVSLHQWPFYPGSGAVTERGGADALGATVNIPLTEGAGDDVYAEAMHRVVVPVVRAFGADVVLISAGFDAFEHDPLASMRVTPAGYAAMMEALVLAGEGSGAPVGAVLEGGYDLGGLEACVAAATRALIAEPKQTRGGRGLEPRHRRDVDQAAHVAAMSWTQVDAQPESAQTARRPSA